jgi:hypothetical protein
MGRLAQGGREPTDLDPLDLEGLSDPIPDSKFPGNGIEDRERSGREGSVDGVDPKGGRGPKRRCKTFPEISLFPKWPRWTSALPSSLFWLL